MVVRYGSAKSDCIDDLDIYFTAVIPTLYPHPLSLIPYLFPYSQYFVHQELVANLHFYDINNILHKFNVNW